MAKAILNLKIILYRYCQCVTSTLLLIITSTLAFAKEFTVDGFSKDYYAKISLEDTTNATYPGGRIAIFDRQNKELIKVEAESGISGQIAANISVLPYGDQSVIMYEDFNFDGKKDFAIENGMESCYGGPAFDIYLADKNRFTYREDFSGLTENNCGMFQVNSKEKTISTMSKNGCCSHVYTDYIVENNKPKEIRSLEEDSFHTPYRILTETIWNGKKWITTSKKTISQKPDDIVLSFKIEKNGKQVFLSRVGDALYYSLLQKNDDDVDYPYNVELTYPESYYSQTPKDFKFDTTQTNRSVSFVNKNASYRIYENSDKKVGIKIEVNGKTFDWIGAEKTKEGSLENLLNVEWGNVVLQ